MSVGIVSVCGGLGLSGEGWSDWESEGVSRSLVGFAHCPVSMLSIFSYVGCIDKEKMKEASMSPWRTPSWDSIVPLYSPLW